MTQFVVRRVLIAIVLVYVVVTLLFLFLHLLPGNPAQLLLSGQGQANPSPATIAAMNHKLGLDRPIASQYLTFLGNLGRGNLGKSFQSGDSVSSDIAQRLPRTLELVIAAVVIALIIGIPLGTIAARRRGGVIDLLIGVVAATGIAVPVYVVGTLAVLLFALKLGWVSAGAFTPFFTNPRQNLSQVLLPALSLSLSLVAIISRMTRASLLEVLDQDYVRTARAKGAGPLRVLVWHALRNAIGPVLTVTGLQMGSLLGGTVLVEYVFNWPGVSSLLVQSVEQRDYPEVQGIVLTISVLFIVLNLLVDLGRAGLEPQTRAAS